MESQFNEVMKSIETLDKCKVKYSADLSAIENDDAWAMYSKEYKDQLKQDLAGKYQEAYLGQKEKVANKIEQLRESAIAKSKQFDLDDVRIEKALNIINSCGGNLDRDSRLNIINSFKGNANGLKIVLSAFKKCGIKTSDVEEAIPNPAISFANLKPITQRALASNGSLSALVDRLSEIAELENTKINKPAINGDTKNSYYQTMSGIF